MIDQRTYLIVISSVHVLHDLVERCDPLIVKRLVPIVQNIQHILALGLGLISCATNIRNEVVPRNCPFLLHD